jgi:large subunit ribosomal protein L16
MLQPRKVKHRKWQKGRRRKKGLSKAGNELAFGAFGLKAEGASWISSRQIEAARRSMTHFVQRGGKIWIRVFPDKPVTTKGTEIPMGGGKGSVDHYVAPIKPGRVLFEIDGISEEIAREAMRRAAFKLPIKTRFIKR